MGSVLLRREEPAANRFFPPGQEVIRPSPRQTDSCKGCLHVLADVSRTPVLGDWSKLSIVTTSSPSLGIGMDGMEVGM